MYLREYPSADNTLIRRKNYIPSTLNPGTLEIASYSMESVNVGLNPILEICEGVLDTIIVLEFKISKELKTVWDRNSNNGNFCYFNIFDFGTRELGPNTKVLPPRVLSVKYTINESFDEGNGYYYDTKQVIEEPSNWNYRNSLNDVWGSKTLIDLVTFNDYNDDILKVDVTSAINQLIANNLVDDSTIQLFIQIDNQVENVNINRNEVRRKWFHSRHTRTMYKPYLEFVINDEIKDSYNLTIPYYTDTNYEFFVLLDNKKALGSSNDWDLSLFEFEANCLEQTGNPTIQAISKHFNYTLMDSRNSIFKVGVSFDVEGVWKLIWKYNGTTIVEDTLEVSSMPIVILDTFSETGNSFIYPTANFSGNQVYVGDKAKIKIVGSSRGSGQTITKNLQYKVITDGNFEMIPWTDCNNHRDQTWAILDTSFFYPNLDYIVVVRYKQGEHGDEIFTSNLIYKFKLIHPGITNLNKINTNPYNPRNTYLNIGQ